MTAKYVENLISPHVAVSPIKPFIVLLHNYPCLGVNTT